MELEHGWRKRRPRWTNSSSGFCDWWPTELWWSPGCWIRKNPCVTRLDTSLCASCFMGRLAPANLTSWSISSTSLRRWTWSKTLTIRWLPIKPPMQRTSRATPFTMPSTSRGRAWPWTSPWPQRPPNGWRFASRPFGGANVVAIGDFNQLPPVEGGYLGDIPRNYLQTGNQDGSSKAQDFLKQAGQRLMWEEFEGVVELTERERCKDAWWNEVTDELRAGKLSEKNWRYLHGKRVQGCTLSEEERRSRRRVITGPNDPRIQEDKFKEAVAIVGTNDAKYQINKDRAQRYAKDTGSQLHWSQARDVASSEVLQVQLCDKERKIQQLGRNEKILESMHLYRRVVLWYSCIAKVRTQRQRLWFAWFPDVIEMVPLFPKHALKCRWLQYHDRDTNNLPGMVPLAIGMNVVLTEHVDRGKGLLRGSVGYVHSLLWNDNYRRPATVYVKFPEAKWELDGINEPGVYPIHPIKREWYLDHGRDSPTLKLQRTQVPLTPGYAMTIHSSQGKTLKAVLLDLAFDTRAPSTIGLVAATRVRSREDVLILRPFDGDLFRRGAPEGPQLLLQKLRGDQIHWDTLRDARRPSAKCSKCAEIKTLDFFSDVQWEQVRANKPAMCRACKNGLPGTRKLDKDAPFYQCCEWMMEKVEDAFPRAQLNQMDTDTARQCLQYLHAHPETLHCCRWQEIKALEEFEPEMPTMPAYATACKGCQQEVQQIKTKKWFPSAVGAGQKRATSCLNCASRGPRANGEQICRNKSCKRKWTEEKQSGQGKRQRYCPQCRRNWCIETDGSIQSDSWSIITEPPKEAPLASPPAYMSNICSWIYVVVPEKNPCHRSVLSSANSLGCTIYGGMHSAQATAELLSVRQLHLRILEGGHPHKLPRQHQKQHAIQTQRRQTNHANKKPGLRGSMRVPGRQNKVTGPQGYRVPNLQGSRVPRLQGYRVQRYRVAGLQG